MKKREGWAIIERYRNGGEGPTCVVINKDGYFITGYGELYLKKSTAKDDADELNKTWPKVKGKNTFYVKKAVLQW